jgi:predicted transcriptional regulator
MSGHTKFQVLRDRLQADPEARALIEQHRQAMNIALALADLRDSLNVSQAELASVLQVSQANISRIEHEDDLHFSTVANYVAALGGQLQVRVVLEDERTIDLTPLLAMRARDQADSEKAQA